MHGQNASWDQLSVLSNGKVPRFYSHKIIKGELQDQSAFCTHLEVTNDTLICCACCECQISLNYISATQPGLPDYPWLALDLDNRGHKWLIHGLLRQYKPQNQWVQKTVPLLMIQS